MPAEIAGVMLPGLGHATRATGETDRGRHDVPVMRLRGASERSSKNGKNTRSYSPQVASWFQPCATARRAGLTRSIDPQIIDAEEASPHGSFNQGSALGG
jgi:hypothetical protein